jgi:transcriptional regulator with XRE-family HTH domain
MGKPGRPSPGLDEYLYWQERLANREASGLSIDEFCADEDISRSTYYRWLQNLKGGIPDAVREEAADLATAEVTEAKFLPISVTTSPIEIELPNGGLVRLPMGVGQAVIVDVIQAVASLKTGRKPLS